MYAALIIDADADAQFAIQNAFSDDPIDFRCANSAQEGIESAANGKTDLVLVRIELPTSSGFSVFSKLRRNPSTKNVPVVLYASDVADDVFTRHASLRTHAEGYLRLPIQSNELHSLIRPLLSLPEPHPSSPTQSLDVAIHDAEDAPPSSDSPWETELSSEDVDSMLNSLEASEEAEELEFDIEADEEAFELELSSPDALDDELEITSDDVDLDFAPLDDVELAAGSPPPAPSGETFTPQPQEAPELASQGAPEPVQPPPAQVIDPIDAPSQAPQHIEPAASLAPTPINEPDLAATASSPSPQFTQDPAPQPDSYDDSASPSPARMGSESITETQPAVSTDYHSQPAIDLNAQPQEESAPAQVKPAANLQAVEPTPLPSEPPPRPAPSAEAEAPPAPGTPEPTTSSPASSPRAPIHPVSSASTNSTAPRSEKREVLALKSQLLQKDRELLALREEIGRFEQEALEQRKAQRGQLAQVAELQAAQLQTEEATLVAQERIEALEIELQQLRSQYAESQEQLQNQQSLGAKAEKRREELENELESLRSQQEAQQTKLQEIEQERQTFQEERERAQSQVEELERQASEGTARIEALEKDVQERDTTLRSRDEQIQFAQESLTGLLDRLKAS